MTRKVQISICLVMILALFAEVVQAQGGTATPRPTPTNVPTGGGGNPPPDTGESGETKGSIRGTVYNDLNADGACVNEPTLAGVPIKFVSDRGDTSVFLQSGANGTYGLVAAGLGTWTVTAEPGAGMIVTSQNPLQVFLGEENTLALNVNFCIADGNAVNSDIPQEEGTLIGSGSSRPGTTGGQQPSGGTGTLFLPTAGAGIAPTLIVTGLSGASLILAGFGIEMRRRRENEAVTKPKSKRKEEK